MALWKGGMASPRCLSLLLVGLSLIITCNAGPLGPLPNVTSSDLGLKEGSCAVGDVVYMPGDEFPGSTVCEKCACKAGEVSCTRQRCETRPGCKALHRPDQCCPTYQCECEQDGRVYGNGEKLVDPADPCRVCYCQGGEVVCRRIACFLRDDCQPRLVPGRCCPEYDNCPLRGVSPVPGLTTTTPASTTIEPSPLPPVPKETLKQEITIKEITPVSEIPVITDVKIKEILPSPSIEVSEYSSSKSPLIPREATSEKNSLNPESTERPVIIEILPSSSPVFTPSSPDIVASSSEISETKSTNDLTPSKISLSTQDSINSDIYPSGEPTMGTIGSPSIIHEIIPVATTIKPAIVLEEEDPILFDHNPAFPPIPDDLSVLSNHEEEISSDPIVETDHVHSSPEIVNVASSTEAPIVTESRIVTSKDVTEAFSTTITSTEATTETTTKLQELTTAASDFKQNPMLNLRSAIPTEILNVPSSVSDDITGELDENDTSPSTESSITIATTENFYRKDDASKTAATSSSNVAEHPSIPGIRIVEITTPEDLSASITNASDENSISTDKSNTATEITAQTEFSSLPIETSDQNPHEETAKDKSATSSAETTVLDVLPTKILPIEQEVITVSRDNPSNTENQSFEHVETTEFVLTSFGSSESATDTVEVIKISPGSGKNAAIIEDDKKNNALSDLINLVGDMASISDHTDSGLANRRVTNAPIIPESEELIPVNAGYKSKNNNWNLNSITEITPKNKHSINKHKLIEIEDDESDSITDSPPPNDNVEPTTRRPIIDNVSVDKPENKTNKKDIEIITQTFVPGVNRRPTKVVMKKNNEKPISEDDSSEEPQISASSESTTDNNVSLSSEVNTQVPLQQSTVVAGSSVEVRSTTLSSSLQ